MNDLHRLFRDIQAEMDDPDRVEVERRLVEAIFADTARHRTLVAAAVHYAVGHLLSLDRPLGPRPVDESGEPPRRQGVRRPVYSAKREGLRAYWRAELLTWQVAPDGARKLFGDFTFDDLMAGAQRRMDQAKTVRQAALSWAELARAVATHGVKTVAELPADVLDRLLPHAEQAS